MIGMMALMKGPGNADGSLNILIHDTNIDIQKLFSFF